MDDKENEEIRENQEQTEAQKDLESQDNQQPQETQESQEAQAQEEFQEASEGKKSGENQEVQESQEQVELQSAQEASETKESQESGENQEDLKQKARIFGKKAARKMKKEVKNLPNKIKSIDVKVEDSYQNVKTNIPVMIFTCLMALIIAAFAATAVFFTLVKGPEKVLVPDVIGKPLEDALLELQVKELYPKINLRYSNTPGDEGTILDQTPEAGSITKGYSRVSLVVSRGVIVDKVDDYVGQSYDEVQLKIQTLFAGQTKPLIIIANPKYKPDASDAGTILEQDPPAGTGISEPVTVNFVVSRGPNFENTKIPRLVGQGVNDLLQAITRHKIIFDITGHIAEEGETAGTVVSQQNFNSEYLPNYTRMKVEMALPKDMIDDNVYGIYTQKLSVYPYPIPMRLEATPPEGNSYTIISFNHPGGELSIPYAVPKGTTLTLYVVDKVNSRKVVN